LETQQLKFNFETAQPQIIGARFDEELKLKLGEFAGPLDLLLYLIKQEQVNIFDLPIARITDEYLKYIRLMEELDISVAGDFLVMAATLIDIKSKMLLPREPLAEIGEEETEDPREQLIKQLLEHQKFKNAAEMLWTKATVEQSVFTRGKLETDDENPEINVGLFDLLSVFQKIAARRKEEISLEITREEITLAEMLVTLKTRLKQNKSLNVNDFFAQAKSRRELILAFLAVLELVKAAVLKLQQAEVFGEILAEATV
jgi:segregation and condensation protein A